MAGGRVVVVGGANVDVVARPGRAPEPATSNPGRVTVTAGGVGRNVAEVLARLGTPTSLVSAVAGDAHGDLVVEASADAGVDLTHVRQVEGRTGAYVALLDDHGELVGGVSDMDDCDLQPGDLPATTLARAALVVLDGNLPPATVARALELATGPVALDPVSVPKAQRLRDVVAAADRRLFLVSAGAAELAALGPVVADLLWERRGPAGSVLTGPDGAVELSSRPVPGGAVVDVTGAGDAMLGAFVHAWLGGDEPTRAAAYAHAAAALTVASEHTVRPDLTDDLVRSLL
ncbi:PfkB family carbohydrate kinase [Nocardioides litoris]|uniref:PfkB family carbohydrate kinase n=1 Tax=Nocardioides litoris TaxID=1926648 RepID=UPI0011224D3E|nr:PfkB family carbohydrate kinase [Nocardioides litoris]